MPELQTILAQERNITLQKLAFILLRSCTVLWGLSLIRAVRAEGSMEGYLPHTKKAAGTVYDPERNGSVA